MRPPGGHGQRTQAHSAHPAPKPASQRKGCSRPQRRAWRGHHSPAGLAPGPCHVEQGDISPMARPRPPLTPPEYTHPSLRVSLHCWASADIPFAPNQPQAPGPDQPRGTARSLPRPRSSPCSRQDSVSLAPRFLCVSCRREAAADAVPVLCESDLEKRLCRLE